MTDYKKLVKALRCKRDDCEGCDLAFLDNDEGWICQYAAKDDDAADAIEALQAEIRESMQKCAECGENEPKRGEIVRCGECKHYNAGFECLVEGYGIERDPDWFCGDGKRKVQE